MPQRRVPAAGAASALTSEPDPWGRSAGLAGKNRSIFDCIAVGKGIELFIGSFKPEAFNDPDDQITAANTSAAEGSVISLGVTHL